MRPAFTLFLLFASLEAIERQASDLTREASAQLFRGDVGTAAVTLEKAAVLYQKVKKPKEEAFAWARLTQVYLALGQYGKASDALHRARTLARTLDFPPAEAIADAIEAVAKMAEYGPTTAYLWSFEKDLSFDQFWPFFADLVVVMADPCVITNSMTCDPMLSSIPMMTEKPSASMARMGAKYLQEGNASEAAEWFKRAADATEEPLQGIKSPESMTSYLGSERRWYYDIAIETLLRSGRAAEAFDYSERSRARAFLQSIGNHRLYGAISNAEYSSLTTVAPLRIEDVRKELPAGTTLISYFVSTYGVRAWIVDADTILALALPIDQAALERTINWATSFRSTNARGIGIDDPASPAIGSAEEAFALLFVPLRKHLRNRRLILIPHGALHYVPFAALRDAGGGCHLVEDYTLTFTPSASALRFIRAKETSIENRALVLGDPTTALGSLPGSAREAAAVAQAFGTRAMLGSRATEDLLYRLEGRIDLLHIAAHGKYDPDRPLSSRIALAPGARHDGKLEVHEILSDLDLTGVNLVVLSACETAAGKRGGGDDIVGLTRAILYAGSPAVISTLWNIEDDASAVLMEEFYRRLRGGESAADALRSAQLALLRRKPYADAHYWAAFTITGDPRGSWKPTDRGSR